MLYEIAQIDPKLADAIAKGFDNAETFLEARAIRHGRAVSPDHLARSVGVIDELRRAALGRRARTRAKLDR